MYLPGFPLHNSRKACTFKQCLQHPVSDQELKGEKLKETNLDPHESASRISIMNIAKVMPLITLTLKYSAQSGKLVGNKRKPPPPILS